MLMRAILAPEPGGPEALRITEVERPAPGPGEVLVKVAAAGVNRADVLQREGHYPPPPGYPDIIGLEVSGVVAELGEGVTGWRPGQECLVLLAAGGYAEYVVAPAGQLVPPPPGIDLVDAAGLLEVAATVVSNMDVAHLAAGEVLLVHGGAGGIGSFAIQYGKALGCTVLATAGSAENLEYCRSLGADHALDYHEDWVAAVGEATDHHGADVILDIIGAKYLPLNVRALAVGGRQVTIGLQGGRKGELNLGVLLNKRASIHATSLRFRPVAEKAAICGRVARSVWPMLAEGLVQPLHTQQVPFEEAARAHGMIGAHGHRGKIVLVVDETARAPRLDA